MPAAAEIDDSAPLPAKLRFAIAQRRLLGLEYNGRLRIAEPHDYGAMNGAGKLLVYQLHVDGRDASRPAAGGGCSTSPKSACAEFSSKSSPAAAATRTSGICNGTRSSRGSSDSRR